MKNKQYFDGAAKLLTTFALPLFLANLLQSCYNMVDMLVVGQYLGGAGLAAVSSASSICFVINSICGGFTIGGSVLVAQYKGANDRKGQIGSIGTLFSLTGICSLIITAIGFAIYRPVFGWMNVPPQAMAYACDYMQTICAGTVFVFGYRAVCAVLRGSGDSKSPLVFVAIASVINIALDYALVSGLGMGTRGAALATVIAQAVSLALSILYLKRKNFLFSFRWSSFKIQKEKCRAILKIGVPSALQMCAINLSYLIVTGMFNIYGVTVAAAAGIGLKINTLVAMPCWAVDQAVTTLSGQSMGAKDTKKTQSIVKFGLVLSVIITSVLVLGLHLCIEPVLSLFTSDKEVIHKAIDYLRICCGINFIPYAVMYISDSFATGVGFAKLSMCNAFIHAVGMKIGLGWLLSRVLELDFFGMCLAESLSPVLPAVVGVVFMMGGKWKKQKLLKSAGD